VDSARFEGLPGAELVQRGLEDLVAGRDTQEALLVRIGAPRLRSLGFSIPPEPPEISPELELYRRLEAEGVATAHSRYNALVRRLVSFEDAAEGQQARARRRGDAA